VKKSVLREILSVSIYFLVVLVLALGFVKFVGERILVNGHSMERTLTDKDHVFVDKISYRFKEPERYDVVVFPFKYADETNYIKRIIGLPGETVKIDEDGNIYINGEVLVESYGTEVMENAGIAAKEITLGAEEYFVLGDNRNESIDSRDISVGPIDKDVIIGRAWRIIYPFDRWGKVK